MQTMIQGYRTSCELVKKRVRELREQRKALLETGGNSIVAELDLERRIRLLYTEYEEMQEIINHLESYVKRSTGKLCEVNGIVKKKKLQ